ncbi:hypothetical protein BAE44_0007215 [Dichanthelium oligosanthes]|uniref:Uncharacterized protein n=1 Tax=Dichanthelium oligosanthes TaxID=888268 RepID=A0A1E5W371_9POAL|nr:hypothetical protein BAE44_0007215 [Dichanthelium oligosanthes]
MEVEASRERFHYLVATDRRIAATLQALIFVCLLAAASGLQILHHDPSVYADSTPKQFRYRPGAAIVIDLGNNNSCVAGYVVAGKTEKMFQHCIPSWVAFTDDGAALVGEAAKNHAKAHPDAAIFGFKRLLGLR